MDARNKYSIPKGYNTTRLILRSLRYYHKSKYMVDKIGKLFGNGLLFVAERIETSLTAFPVGQAVNVYPAIYQTAFNIILRSLFDIDLSRDTMSEISALFNEMQEFVIKDMNRPLRRLTYVFTRKDKISMRHRNRLPAGYAAQCPL